MHMLVYLFMLVCLTKLVNIEDEITLWSKLRDDVSVCALPKVLDAGKVWMTYD